MFPVWFILFCFVWFRVWFSLGVYEAIMLGYLLMSWTYAGCIRCRIYEILFLNPPTIIFFSLSQWEKWKLFLLVLWNSRINHTNFSSQQISCNCAPLFKISLEYSGHYMFYLFGYLFTVIHLYVLGTWIPQPLL